MCVCVCVCVGGGGGFNGCSCFNKYGGGGGGMVVFIKCAVCYYTVAPRVNFSEEIIKYFELEL